MIKTIMLFVMCHMVGDYLFQTDFIAQTKGSNWYHMIVHCVLYCVPFALAFGLTWQLVAIGFMHCIVDTCKARYKVINYTQDQIIHLSYVGLYFMGA